MAKNLRDRGYSSSMDGMHLPKAQERHSRQKTVTPGEASVSKGRKVTPETRSTPSYGSVPEYNPVYPGGNATQSTPLNLQFTDPADEAAAYRRGPGPYAAMREEQRQLVPGETRSNLSPEELRKRIRQLEEAMAAMDAGHSKFRSRIFSSEDNTEYQAPYLPYMEGEEHPAQAIADFNWNKAELLDDAGLELGASPAQQQLLWMDYQKAAAIGRALEEQHNQYISNNGIPGYKDAMAEENQYGSLYNEYNNLRNEYNARLAQYLQGLR